MLNRLFIRQTRRNGELSWFTIAYHTLLSTPKAHLRYIFYYLQLTNQVENSEKAIPFSPRHASCKYHRKLSTVSLCMISSYFQTEYTFSVLWYSSVFFCKHCFRQLDLRVLNWNVHNGWSLVREYHVFMHRLTHFKITVYKIVANRDFVACTNTSTISQSQQGWKQVLRDLTD